MISVLETVCNPTYYLDSGSSNHIASNSANLFKKISYNGEKKIKVANGNSSSIFHIITCSLILQELGECFKIFIGYYCLLLISF